MESGTIRKLGAVSYSPSILYIKYGAILYHVRDIATYWLKIAKFLRGGVNAGVKKIAIFGQCRKRYKIAP